jgi:hypothetical protein
MLNFYGFLCSKVQTSFVRNFFESSDVFVRIHSRNLLESSDVICENLIENFLERSDVICENFLRKFRRHL